jgi:SAM-dependent methyltransferase
MSDLAPELEIVPGFGILSRDPLVIHTFWYSGDIYEQIIPVSRKIPTHNAIFLISNAWSILMRWRFGNLDRLFSTAKGFGNDFPRHRVIFLGNDEAETILLRQLGLESFFFNHNAFADYQYAVDLHNSSSNMADRIWDAVYIARIERYKRIELMSALDRACVIYATCDLDYFRSIEREVSNVRFLNGHPDRGPYRYLAREEINATCSQAGAGLCLSETEGAMFASVEYLLNGIPVISTPSLGGRDVFFTRENSIQCDPNSNSVRDAVIESRKRSFDPLAIRADASARIVKFRIDLVEFLTSLGKGVPKSPDLAGLLSSDYRFMWKRWTVDELIDEAGLEARADSVGTDSPAREPTIEPSRRRHHENLLGSYGNSAKEKTDWFLRFMEQYIPGRGNTELCNIMNRRASDKGNGWHTYTQFYQYLFGPIRNIIYDILEVGIGTNNTDVLSSMGPLGTPGASLRGWRDFFPNAQVIGADIDSRILFEEERIRTFHVDQQNSVSVKEMWDRCGDIELDIIVDDGLHIFQANECFFKESFSHLRKGGVYVIEDIVIREDIIALYQKLLMEQECTSLIFELPNEQNHYDNCLSIAWKDA